MVPKMSPGIVPEDLVTFEPALPTQFYDAWHRTHFIASEQALALAVLWQAVIDLRKFRFAPRRRQQRLYMEAYRWVASDDRSWPFTFANLCDSFNLSPEVLRATLLGDAAPLSPAASEEPTSAVEQAA